MSEVHKKLTAEEIREALSAPIDLPKDAKKFLSGKRLDEALACMQDPTLIELDILANEIGADEWDEYQEYASTLPEWRDLRRRYMEKLDELYQFLIQRLPAAVKKSFDVTKDFNPAPILELYSVVARTSNAIADAHKGVPSPNVALFQRDFLNDLFSRLTFDMVEEFNKLPRAIDHQGRKIDVTRPLNQRMNHLYEHLQRTNRQVFPFGHPGFAEQNSHNAVKQTHVKFQKGFNALAQSESGHEMSIEELQHDVNEKHEMIAEVFDEVSFERFEYSGDGFRLVFNNLRPHLGVNSRANYLFQCKLIFDLEQELDLDPIIEKRGHAFGLKYDVGIGWYDLIAEMQTSDLRFSGALGYGAVVKDKKKMLQVTNHIYQVLLDHLLDLEEQMPKSVSHPGDRVEELAETVHGQLEAIFDFGPKTVKDEAKEALPEKKRANVSLRNRKGSRVLRALKKILGQPVRCEGTSHFIFEGKDGNTYPIAVHGDKDVGVGLLSSCLKRFGISRVEFDAAY